MGLASILAAVGAIAKAYSTGGIAGLASQDWPTIVAAIASGFGLLFARDNVVPSAAVPKAVVTQEQIKSETQFITKP